MTNADAKTDISDESWDELIDQPEAVKDLGKEYDAIDGRWSVEKILARVFVIKGRAHEVPDEFSEYVTSPGSEIEADEDEEDDQLEAETQVVDDDDAVGTRNSTPEAPVEDDRDFEEEDEETGRNQKLGADNDTTERDASWIIEASTFQTWLNYIDVLVEEAKVHLNEDGMKVRAVDPANVGMVDTDLYRDAFESYDVGDEGIIGVSTEKLSRIVKDPNKGDLIHLRFDAVSRNLEVSWGGHTFTISLINPDSIRSEPDLPDLDLPAEVTVEEARTLHTAIGYADDVSDHVALTVDATEETFEVYAEGDTDEYEGEFVDPDVGFRQLGDAHSLFSLEYLKDMSDAWDKDEELIVHLGEEFPLEVKQSIPSPQDENDAYVGEATYLLAPRIQSD